VVMFKVRTWVLLALALVAPFSGSGCVPYSMGPLTPIPVPAWVTERMEEKFVHKNDFRTPILPPIRDGFPPPICEDFPDLAMVIRAMPKIPRGVPYFYEEFRDEIDMIPERIVDRIDPPRFFPLVGMAQLHHCHFKCTVSYIETIESNYPFPFRAKAPKVQVVLIDKDHLHIYPTPTPEGQRAVQREVGGYY